MIDKSMRQSDYLGRLDDDALYALLSNTSEEGSQPVLNRFRQAGLEARIMEVVTV